MVSLLDFDPDRVVVLDWYEVVLLLFPDVDVTDRELCERKLEFISRFIYFEPYHYSDRSPVYWINPEMRPEAKDQPEFPMVKKQFMKFCDTLLALDWLLPSGIVLDDVKNSGLISSFFHGDNLYASFADGCVVLVKPELHEEFLPLYLKKDNVKAVENFSVKETGLEYLDV